MRALILILTLTFFPTSILSESTPNNIKIFVVNSNNLNYSYRNDLFLMNFYRNLKNHNANIEIQSYYFKNENNFLGPEHQSTINKEIQIQLDKFSPNYILIVGPCAFTKFALPELYLKFRDNTYYINLPNSEQLKEKYDLNYINGTSIEYGIYKLENLLDKCQYNALPKFLLYDKNNCSAGIISAIKSEHPSIEEFTFENYEQFHNIVTNLLQKKVKGILFCQFRGTPSTKTGIRKTAEELYLDVVKLNDKHLEVVVNDDLTHFNWAISLSSNTHSIINNTEQSDYIYSVIFNKTNLNLENKIFINKGRIEKLNFGNILKFDKYIDHIEEN